MAHQPVEGCPTRHGNFTWAVGVIQLLLELSEHRRSGHRRSATRVREHLLDRRDDAQVGAGTWRLRAQGALVREPDQTLVPVGLAQPLKVPLRYLGARGLEVGDLRLLALVHSAYVRVILRARRPLRRLSRLQFHEVPLKPADPLLLGLTEDREPSVLGRSPGRRGIKRLESGCRKQVSQQHC